MGICSCTTRVIPLLDHSSLDDMSVDNQALNDPSPEETLYIDWIDLIFNFYRECIEPRLRVTNEISAIVALYELRKDELNDCIRDPLPERFNDAPMDALNFVKFYKKLSRECFGEREIDCDTLHKNLKEFAINQRRIHNFYEV